MRKSLSYKQGRKLIRSWVRRLTIGSALSYLAGLGVMALFRHFGSDPLLIVGFLCVFTLMPAIVLVAFSLPGHQGRGASGRLPPHAALLVPLAMLLIWAGMP